MTTQSQSARALATEDASRCPLCGAANRCAMEIARETGHAAEACWCMTTDFSAELLARVPAAQRRKACICERCAASAELGQG